MRRIAIVRLSAIGDVVHGLPLARSLRKLHPDARITRVEEIPAFEPCGEGEHFYLRVEKRGVSHEQLTRHIANILGISRGDIGTAGMKDRQAVTRQWVSVPAACGSAAIDDLSTRARRWADLAQRLGARLRHGRAVNLDPSALILDTVLKIQEAAAQPAAG